MPSVQWSIPLEEVIGRAKARVDTVVRVATFELFKSVELRSPVGNPDLWKKNSQSQHRRDTYNWEAERHNNRVLSSTKSYSPRTGGLKKGVKLYTAKSARALRRMFPNVAGRGYIGGRFRANWNVSLGAPDYGTTLGTNAGHSDSQINSVLRLPTGSVMYLANGLPYAYRLEHGWSTQAPQGMVRLAVAEFDLFLQTAIASVK